MNQETSYNLIKSGMDIFAAIGLSQLAPTTITPCVTSGLGFITSAIACYHKLERMYQFVSSCIVIFTAQWFNTYCSNMFCETFGFEVVRISKETLNRFVLFDNPRPLS